MKLSRIVVAVAVLVAIGGHAHGQSLGDLAKKTAAEREKAKAATPSDPKATDPKPAEKKVYTDDDLKKIAASVPGSTVPPVVPAADAPKDDAAAKPAAPPPADGVKDEAWWKARAKTLDQQIDADQTLLDAAVRHMNSLASELQPSEISLLTVSRDLHAAEAEVRRLRAVVDNEKRTRADLEEEARQANVPPGWLRWR